MGCKSIISLVRYFGVERLVMRLIDGCMHARPERDKSIVIQRRPCVVRNYPMKPHIDNIAAIHYRL